MEFLQCGVSEFHNGANELEMKIILKARFAMQPPRPSALALGKPLVSVEEKNIPAQPRSISPCDSDSDDIISLIGALPSAVRHRMKALDSPRSFESSDSLEPEAAEACLEPDDLVPLSALSAIGELVCVQH